MTDAATDVRKEIRHQVEGVSGQGAQPDQRLDVAAGGGRGADENQPGDQFPYGVPAVAQLPVQGPAQVGQDAQLRDEGLDLGQGDVLVVAHAGEEFVVPAGRGVGFDRARLVLGTPQPHGQGAQPARVLHAERRHDQVEPRELGVAEPVGGLAERVGELALQHPDPHGEFLVRHLEFPALVETRDMGRDGITDQIPVNADVVQHMGVRGRCHRVNVAALDERRQPLDVIHFPLDEWIMEITPLTCGKRIQRRPWRLASRPRGAPLLGASTKRPPGHYRGVA